MKFGLRMPSIKKRIAARTSVKRYIRHSLGLKAPRGWGWVTNPQKALYNRVYHRTTFSLGALLGGGRRRSKSAPGCLLLLAALAAGLAALAVVAGKFL